MDRQGTTNPADRHEQVDELGFGAQQLGELVQDDEQGRQRRVAVPPGKAVGLVAGDVGVVASLPEQFLTPYHFAAQRVLHAVDQRQFRLEVGDHGRDVGQVGHAGERRTAFEVDQYEVELFGTVGQGERQRERAQHLRLARPGGPDQQPVRPDPLLGGLLDVEGDRNALGRHSERDPQPVAAGAAHPLPVGVEVADVAQAEQFHQINAASWIGTASRGLGLGTLGLDPARHAPRHRLGLGHRDGVRHRDDRFAVEQHDLHRAAGLTVGGMQDHSHRGERGQRTPSRRQRDHRDPGRPLARAKSGGGWQHRIVHNDQHLGPWCDLAAGLERRPGRHLLTEKIGQFGVTGRNHPGRAQRVLLLRRSGVWRPLDPFPLGTRGVAAQHGDLEHGGRDEGGQVRDHRADGCPGRLGGAGHLKMRELPERDRQRHVVHRPMGG